MQDLSRPSDRRRKSDIVIKLVTVASAIGWLLIALCTTITVYAKPEQNNFFYRLFNIQVRDYWNYSLLNIVLYLLIFLLAISIIGIVLNAMRQRRRTDKINKSLIFQAIISIIGIIILLADVVFI